MDKQPNLLVQANSLVRSFQQKGLKQILKAAEDHFKPAAKPQTANITTAI